MDDKNNKSLIIAKRIKLKFIGELVASCVLFAMFFALTILGIVLQELILIIISVLILVVISVCCFFSLKKIYINNHSNEVMITYKNDTFTIVDDVNPLQIKKSDIIDLDYKLKKLFVYTPYFIGQSEYNYGKFYIYFKEGKEEFKITLYNVAEPYKVCDKMIKILGWDVLEE